MEVSDNLLTKAMMLFDTEQDSKISFQEFADTIERLDGDLTKLWEQDRLSQQKRLSLQALDKAAEEQQETT